MVKHKIISILFLNSKRTNCNWYTTQVSIVTLKHSGFNTFRIPLSLGQFWFFLSRNSRKQLLNRKLRFCFDKKIDIFKLGPKKFSWIGWLIVKQWEDWKVKFCESFTQLHFGFVVFLVDRQEQQQFMKRLHEYIITMRAACYAKNSRSSSRAVLLPNLLYERRDLALFLVKTVYYLTLKIRTLTSLFNKICKISFFLLGLFVQHSWHNEFCFTKS